MATVSWTPSQQQAIETRGKTLLISAAAGSGKTATLTERIIRSIKREDDPVDLSRLLIVTFTRAAAADLKAKISRALADALAKDPQNEHLSTQIMLLSSANISTIDSFYYDIFKSNFGKLSLPGNLRIMEQTEVKLLYESVMEDVIDRFYAEDPEFEDFVDHFADVRSTDKIAEVFIGIYESLLSFRDGVDLLKQYQAQFMENEKADFFATPHGRVASESLCAALGYIRDGLSAAEDYFESDATLSDKYLPAFRKDRMFAEGLLTLIQSQNYTAAREAILAHTHEKLGSVKNPDPYTVRFKALRDRAKDLLKGMKTKFFSLSPEELTAHTRTTAHICGKAHQFLSAFDQKLAKEKLTRGICDFPDIRRYVMKLIVDENGGPTPLALEMRERFDEIYIDEYQDTDEVQDLIFSTIAKPNNRFMVGDIKQSIYGFRGSEPSIFAGYKRIMPQLGAEESEAYSIFMSNNFRCDENIIDFSNLVSSYLFRNCGESIEYSPSDDLQFSKSKPTEDYESPKVVVALTGIVSGEEPEEEKEDSEALYIAAEIRRLLSEEKKADGSSITPRDIAILMRNKKQMTAIMDLLIASGIPACSSEEHNFFENPDVLLILSLLSAIDNPQRDVSLAGALCSPFWGMTLEELILIREHGTATMSLYDALESYAELEVDPLAEKCRACLASLAYWRDQAQALPVDKLMRKLYRELAVLSMQGVSETNLLRLYEYARNYESGSFRGLYNFIRYINDVIDSGRQISDGSGDTDVDAVRLITIHHSKGLEFPVCFIYGTGHAFNTSFKRDKILFEPSVGIGFRLHDESGVGYYDTPIRQAVIHQKEIMGVEEEMRILYVAMTRARERLYVTAEVKDLDKAMDAARNLAEFGKGFGIRSAKCYMDWILAAMVDAGEDSPKCDCLTLVTAERGEIAPIKAPLLKPQAEQAAIDLGETDTAILACLRERFSFVYPFEHVSDLPAKLSVSRLYPSVLDEGDETDSLEALSDTNYEALFEEQFRMPEQLTDRTDVTAADRGTATHTFLQFCDFDRVRRTGVREELARLSEMRFIAPEMADMVNVKQLEVFFESRLFERILAAKHVWREQRFNIFLPAADFTRDRQKAALLADETVAVQGVIDIFFEEENGNIVLCDYKTDYLTREEREDSTLAAAKLTARHGLQLGYYARAIRQMCGKAPKEVLIYSLPLGGTVSIPQTEN